MECTHGGGGGCTDCEWESKVKALELQIDEAKKAILQWRVSSSPAVQDALNAIEARLSEKPKCDHDYAPFDKMYKCEKCGDISSTGATIKRVEEAPKKCAECDTQLMFEAARWTCPTCG